MPKHLLHGPVIFGVIGAVLGVSYAMMFRYDVRYQDVYMDLLLPMVLGVGCGIGSGFLAMKLYLRLPGVRGLIEISTTALVLAGLGALHGWHIGDKRQANPPAEMLWGLLGGLILGACIGTGYFIMNWRRSSRLAQMNHPNPISR